jgi:hypothetical protein
MNVHPEIQINKFQLGILLTGLDKKFFNCIIENNIYCSHCKNFAIKGILVDTIYLTKLNDVRVFGRCKICNSEVARLFEFGNEKVFREKANKLRESIKERTLLKV